MFFKFIFQLQVTCFKAKVVTYAVLTSVGNILDQVKKNQVVKGVSLLEGLMQHNLLISIPLPIDTVLF